MRRIIIASAITTLAWVLYSAVASAEVLHRGKVYKTTADRIIEHERMRCIYGRTKIDPETGAIVTPKVCVTATERDEWGN